MATIKKTAGAEKAADKKTAVKKAAPVKPAVAESTAGTEPAAPVKPAATEPAAGTEPAATEAKELSEQKEGAATKAGDDNLLDKSATANSDALHEAMKPYVDSYPGEKMFFITSDGQVFLGANKTLAEEHQQGIDKTQTLTQYGVLVVE